MPRIERDDRATVEILNILIGELQFTPYATTKHVKRFGLRIEFLVIPSQVVGMAEALYLLVQNHLGKIHPGEQTLPNRRRDCQVVQTEHQES
jgi:hypothetical protein